MNAHAKWQVCAAWWLTLLMALSACNDVRAGQATDYTVVNVFPHDSSAYTQGLIAQSGVLIEGTGLRKHSDLRRVELSSGRVIERRKLQPRYFGEGITALGNYIYQLTWNSGLGFIYDLETFRLLRTFDYQGEGWGLTHDGEMLIMSNGSAELLFIDPKTLELIDSLVVADGFGPVHMLNELEFVDGKILANVYRSDHIVEIDPTSGRVTKRIDLSALSEAERLVNRKAKELNGIAYDNVDGRLFITGKFWAHVYEIELH